MKTQAWGWLTAAVLAAGLNSSYHNGGLQWAHEVVDRVQHNSSAVLALATGRTDRFLAEARIVKAHRQAQCPLATALAESQDSLEQQEWQIERVQAMSDRQQEQLARFEQNRARIESRVQARLARVQFNPVVVAEMLVSPGLAAAEVVVATAGVAAAPAPQKPLALAVTIMRSPPQYASSPLNRISGWLYRAIVRRPPFVVSCIRS